MKRAALAASLIGLALLPSAAAAGVGGVADSSFGAGGLATVSSAVAGSRESGNAMVLDGQGRILVGGGALGKPPASPEGGWVLTRFRSDGSLDTGFGDDGIAKAPGLYGAGLSEYGQAIRALAIEPGTGKIIAGGMTVDPSHFGEYTVARYNTDGSLDMSFGPADTGFVSTHVSASSSDDLEAMTVSSDGTITAVGAAGLGAGLARWNSDGVLDQGFDGPGVPGNGAFADQPTAGFDTYRSVAVEADGSLRVVGVATTGGESNWLIARYLPSGARDGSFGGGGFVTTDFGGQSDLGGDQILLGNTLYAFGSVDTDPGKSTERDFGVDAFNATTGAEIPGTLTLASLPDTQNLFGVALQRLGGSGDPAAQRFLLVGTGAYGGGGGGGALLMRMRRVGGSSTALELDPEFGSAGIVPPPRTSGIWDDVATDGQGRVVVGGELGIYETADLAAARYLDLPSAPPKKDLVAPVISKLKVTPRAWAVKPRGKAEVPLLREVRRGTSFRYSLSESARVGFRIERRRARGRKARFVGVASFAQAGKAGANRKPFGGRVGKRSLKPGRYRATLTATDAAGNSSAPKRVSFKIVRP